MGVKEDIYQLIVDALAHDFEVLFNAAKTAHEAATHEENIPDNKYDTLSLEASYVAQGQANRAQEIKAALESYGRLELVVFGADTPVRLSALVTLEDAEGGRKTVFLGPGAGGLRVPHTEGEVTVITPQSPLGRQLLGKRTGDSVACPSGRGMTREYDIVRVL